MRTLIVEDEADLANALSRALAEHDFAVDVARDGEDGLHRARETAYDVIVLDVLLPIVDGWTVLERLRSVGCRTPVMMLTARDAIADRVRGLNLGADDYLLKPFALEELIARLRALGRRAVSHPSPLLIVGDVEIDTVARRVFRDGREVDLTGREYSILEILARARGTIVRRQEIARHLYDDDAEFGSNAIDVHIAALRKKLGGATIHTRRGLGYLIQA